jgi:ferrochelatase
LLINLGSPRAPEKDDVARYLNEFLMDPYVVDIPAWLRWPLVHALITPRRAEPSAAAYRKIWTEQGSPLVLHTRAFAESVRSAVGSNWEVRWGMRYGEPSVAAAVKDWAIDELYVVPLYPQYAESSTRTAIEHVRHLVPASLPVRGLADFHAEPEFITAQAEQIESRVREFHPDHLLLSYHGLPEHHMIKLHPTHCLQNADCCNRVDARNRFCYRAQAMGTSRALRNRLSLAPERISVSFQSRLGRRPWIKPYTDVVVGELAAGGVRRLLVSCPSFVADCLETLEEIQIRLRAQFLKAGGEDLALVPALNAEPAWVQSFVRMIARADLEWWK